MKFRKIKKVQKKVRIGEIKPKGTIKKIKNQTQRMKNKKKKMQ